MTVNVKVWSDFVCPFCMIAEAPLQQAIEEVGEDVHIEWMPFELRPYPTPTLRPEDPYLQQVWPQSVYPLAEQYGVQLTLPSVSPQPHTGLAWEGYQFAREKGKAQAYNDKVLRAFFQKGQDIGDIEVLTRLAGEVGIDELAFRESLKQRRYRDIHRRELQLAQEMGVRSVPTFMIGTQRFTGVQPREALLAALREEARAQD